MEGGAGGDAQVLGIAAGVVVVQVEVGRWQGGGQGELLHRGVGQKVTVQFGKIAAAGGCRGGPSSQFTRGHLVGYNGVIY